MLLYCKLYFSDTHTSGLTRNDISFSQPLAVKQKLLRGGSYSICIWCEAQWYMFLRSIGNNTEIASSRSITHFRCD